MYHLKKNFELGPQRIPNELSNYLLYPMSLRGYLSQQFPSTLAVILAQQHLWMAVAASTIKITPKIEDPRIMSNITSSSLRVVVAPICHNVISPFLMPVTKYLLSTETSITKISAWSALANRNSGYYWLILRKMMVELAEKMSWPAILALTPFGAPNCAVEYEQLKVYCPLAGLSLQAFRVRSLQVMQNQSEQGLNSTHFSRAELSVQLLTRVLVARLYINKCIGVALSLLTAASRV